MAVRPLPLWGRRGEGHSTEIRSMGVSMDNLKTVLRIGGIFTAAAGGLCLPFPNYVFDKGDLSRFHNLADAGVFTWMGLGLIAVGLVGFGLSFLVRGDMTD